MDSNIDWQSRKTLPERMKYMLDNELLCDVTFRVGPDQTPIKAHKYMLVSASPIFYSMFEGPMAEKGEVVILDVTSDIFQVILEFIYTDDGDVNVTNVIDILYGAEKYMLQVLKEKCCTFLSSNIDTGNACLILQVAHILNVEVLKKQAFTYILRNASECLKTVRFLSLATDCVKQIIQSDNLQCREEIVCNRALEWARTKCKEERKPVTDRNIRQELGELIYLIRFPVIQPEYFTHKMSNSRILTSDEKVDIYQSFHTKRSDSFLTKCRKNAIEFRRCEKQRYYVFELGSDDNCIDFKTNFKGVLSAITVFGSVTCSGTHKVKLNILKGSVNLGTTEMTLCSTAGQKIYRIPLAKAIEVEVGSWYSIQLNMVGPNTFSGKEYVTNVTINEMSITFLRSSLRSPKTNEYCGQIPGLVFDPQ